MEVHYSVTTAVSTGTTWELHYFDQLSGRLQIIPGKEEFKQIIID